MEITGKYGKAIVFTDNIEPEAVSQVYELLNTKMTENETVRIMEDCLTEDTEVLTENGFKKIIDLDNTVRVANYNPDTQLVEFYSPKNILIRDLRKDEKVYKYNNTRGYSFRVSQRHRLALKNNMGELAENIDSFLMKENIFNAKGVSTPINKYTDNEIRILCWIIGDGVIANTHNPKRISRNIRFGLKKERKINRIIQLFDEEGYKYGKSEYNKQTVIRLSVKDSEKYINLVTLKKKFPSDLIFMSQEQSKIFFEELIQVDGDYENYINNNHGSYRINSKDLDTLNLISAIATINKGLSKIVLKTFNGYNGLNQIHYINIIDDSKLNYSRNGIHNSKFQRNEVEYCGKLVCIETNTGYFIAKQGGLTFITGNCHAGKGCVEGYTQTYSGGPLDPDVVGCDISCLDCDTEVLTPTGWIKISNYADEEIMQFDPETDEGKFLKPIKYIKSPCTEFHQYYNKKSGLDQLISSEHNLLVYSGYWKGHKLNHRKITPIELDKLNLSKGFYGFKTCFNISNNPGVSLSNEMIRIDIMVQADGKIIPAKDHNRIELHFRKKRKIERAKKLLEDANIEYKISILKDKSTSIRFNVDFSINKDLKKYYLATKEQLEIVKEECLLWDGHNGYRSSYSNTNKDNIDVIQFAFSATNTRAGISEILGKERWNIVYYVSPARNKIVTYNKKSSIVPSIDGFKYCFTTNTGYFVCRRNGRIFITGNCGMLSVKYKTPSGNSDLALWDARIRRDIPMGMEINEKTVIQEKEFKKFFKTKLERARSLWPEFVCYEGLGEIEKFISKTLKRIGMSEGIFYKSLGTLGGGEKN